MIIPTHTAILYDVSPEKLFAERGSYLYECPAP